MALIKEITLNNGIKVNYHRIASINNITNKATIIEIQSYINKEKREKEKNSIKNSLNMNIFINTEYLNIDYSPTLDVDKAYDYIKTLDKFQNSTDDM